jgi:rsbT co-antagonist protein RsbR
MSEQHGTQAVLADRLRAVLVEGRAEVVASWAEVQLRDRHAPADEGLVVDRAESLLDALVDGLAASHGVDLGHPGFQTLRDLLAAASTQGARAGATPTETATAVLSLREVLLERADPDLTRLIGRLVDAMALVTFETFVAGRQDIIGRQRAELLDLSTPVVRLWDGIVAVPLVGTLDSSRAQVVMEALLQAIVDQRARVAILDITGVPTVDTLVAQHLLKTVTATRLMGADAIISGIRPSTAQTIVQLGIDLSDITTRSTLADALETAIARVSDPAAGG